jgi:hypothetical protein
MPFFKILKNLYKNLQNNKLCAIIQYMFYFLHIIMKIINKVFVGLGVLSIFVVSFVIVNASYQE